MKENRIQQYSWVCNILESESVAGIAQKATFHGF